MNPQLCPDCLIRWKQDGYRCCQCAKRERERVLTARRIRARSPKAAHPVAYQIHLKPRGSYAALFLGRVIAPVGV